MGKVVKIIGLYFQSLGKKNLIRRKSFGSNFLFKPTIHLFGHNEFDGFPNVLPCGIRAVMDCTKSQTGKPVVLNNIFISFVKFNTLNFLNFFSKVTVFKLAFPQRMKIRAVKKHPRDIEQRYFRVQPASVTDKIFKDGFFGLLSVSASNASRVNLKGCLFFFPKQIHFMVLYLFMTIPNGR